MASLRDSRLRPLSLILNVTFVLVAAGCAGEVPDAEEEAPDERVPKVLVIGIDGVRPDVLAAVATPNLDRLSEEGWYSDQAQTGLPTVSGPSWSSMLTGVWSDKHGVTDNTFEGKNYDEFPDFLTRIEVVAPELETFAVADWTPLVSEGGGGPLISPNVDEVVTLDGYVFGWPQADAMSVDVAINRLERRDIDALFVYLGNPDETSHQSQSIGVEYRGAIEEADRQVGRLIAALEGRPSYANERWLIVVSTDHGRLEDGDHGGESAEERTIFFLVSGPDAASTEPSETPQVVDVAVTALAHLGIEIDEGWGLDGKAIGLRR